MESRQKKSDLNKQTNKQNIGYNDIAKRLKSLVPFIYEL
jgi:hypothetical protein